ncbi:hypothetical protein SADUNF_Sadunf02G0173600 [Salix dunnii]|uniref:Uncharacterized protein n=1 Tax=Salix dunnii TaxID=1413687 RepID=A0A835N8F0_9ROSI|nr:hypothetical protein SADUNF_Sadunf02G0173600 [Salix dunnii]
MRKSLKDEFTFSSLLIAMLLTMYRANAGRITRYYCHVPPSSSLVLLVVVERYCKTDLPEMEKKKFGLSILDHGFSSSSAICTLTYNPKSVVPSLDFETRPEVCLRRLSGLIEGVKGRKGRRKPSFLSFHTLEVLFRVAFRISEQS